MVVLNCQTVHDINRKTVEIKTSAEAQTCESIKIYQYTQIPLLSTTHYPTLLFDCICLIWKWLSEINFIEIKIKCFCIFGKYRISRLQFLTCLYMLSKYEPEWRGLSVCPTYSQSWLKFHFSLFHSISPNELKQDIKALKQAI